MMLPDDKWEFCFKLNWQFEYQKSRIKVMDNVSEREQPKPERIISIGEKFQPFDRQYTIDRPQA